MHKYDSYNHSKFSIKYHIILSVKYPRKMLMPIIDDLKKSFDRAAIDQPWKIAIVETDAQKDHHVHLLVKARPSIAPNQIVARLKQFSTYDQWNKNRSYMVKYFWNGEHHLWTRGYFCSTIGEVSEQKIRQYIKRQG